MFSQLFYILISLFRGDKRFFYSLQRCIIFEIQLYQNKAEKIGTILMFLYIYNKMADSQISILMYF